MSVLRQGDELRHAPVHALPVASRQEGGQAVTKYIRPDYGLLVKMREDLKKKYANGIMTRQEYMEQEREISKQIGDSEKGRRTGKVI